MLEMGYVWNVNHRYTKYMAHIVGLIKINFTECKVYRDVRIDYFDILTILYCSKIDLISNVYSILTVLSPTAII